MSAGEDKELSFADLFTVKARNTGEAVVEDGRIKVEIPVVSADTSKSENKGKNKSKSGGKGKFKNSAVKEKKKKNKSYNDNEEDYLGEEDSKESKKNDARITNPDKIAEVREFEAINTAVAQEVGNQPDNVATASENDISVPVKVVEPEPVESVNLVQETLSVEEIKEYINGDFFLDLLKVTWGNWNKTENDLIEARNRLQELGLNIDYQSLGEEGIKIKQQLSILDDHFIGKKRLDVADLIDVEKKILSLLKLEVSDLDKELAGDVKKQKNEVAVELEKTIENEKLVEYLGREFLSDLETIYPKRGVEPKGRQIREARERHFVVYKFVKATIPLRPDHQFAEKSKNKDQRDFRIRDIFVEYFKLDEGLPEIWKKDVVIKIVGGDEERYKNLLVSLEEARMLRKREGFKKDVESPKEKKTIVDDERSGEKHYVELMKLASTEAWNMAMRELQTYKEPQKSYAFGFMKVAYEWMINPDKMKQAQGGQGRWHQTYAPLLRRLGIKVDE